MGGVVLTFAAAFSDTLSFFKQIAQAAAASPFRSVLIAVGIVLIISAFWENILDAAGLHSDKRLLAKISSWLHFTFGYALIETNLHDNGFTIITEDQDPGRRYGITKKGPLPILKIATHVISEEFKEILVNMTVVERHSLRQDVVIELAQLDLESIEISFNDNAFRASCTSSLVLNKDFDQFRLMEGINTARRASLLAFNVYGKWLRKHFPEQFQAAATTKPSN